MITGIEKPQPVSIGDSLNATYNTEQFTYYRHSGNGARPTLHIAIKSASTTTGNNIVSSSHDATGVMVWPATHLICQHLASNSFNPGDCVLELGCGCGLAGITACLSRRSTLNQWVSTDMDERALDLCRENYAVNGISIDVADSVAKVESLRWGDENRIASILHELRKRYEDDGKLFDSLVGADIVYPSTCGQVLLDLLRTVDALLKPGGTFWLSFATRDGPRTPYRLLEVASETGFAVDCFPPLDSSTANLMPPMLDSKLLILKRSVDARDRNAMIGYESCRIFPGMLLALDHLDNPSSDDDWDAPPLNDDTDG